MEFLADENVYTAVVDLLRQRGFTVEHVLRSAPTSPDEDVLARSVERVLITSDRDFGALVYGRGVRPSPRGVLYLRVGTASPSDVAERVASVVENPLVELDGWFTVLAMGSIRQRPLP